MAGFAKFGGIGGGGQITLVDQRIDASSDMAVETCVETETLVPAEHQATLHHRVTNVYRKAEGGRKLAHHHTDPSSAIVDVLRRLT